MVMMMLTEWTNILHPSHAALHLYQQVTDVSLQKAT